MGIIAKRITSDEIADLIQLNLVPVIKHYPPLEYFFEYLSKPTNRTFLFSFGGDEEILITGELKDSELICSSRAFYNSFYCRNLDSIDSLQIEKIVNFYGELGLKSLKFRLPSEIISGKSIDLANFQLDLRCFTSVVNLERYEFSNRRSRAIKKAISQGLVFEKVTPENLKSTWEYLESFLMIRNLPSLPTSRVLNLLTNYPDYFQLVRVVNSVFEIVAVALSSSVGNTLRLPNYCGDRKYDGAIDLLLSEILILARNQGFSFVDLGVSMDPKTETEVPGIVQFKSEFGATRFEVFDKVIHLR